MGGATALAVGAKYREQLASEAQKAEEAVFGPEIKTLGIYDGNAQIFWEVDDQPLTLRKSHM